MAGTICSAQEQGVNKRTTEMRSDDAIQPRVSEPIAPRDINRMRAHKPTMDVKRRRDAVVGAFEDGY